MPQTDHNVVIAPDSFKGCLDAPAVASVLAAGLTRTRSDLLPICRGLADGGEGTLDALAAAGGAVRHTACLRAIHGREIDAPWLELPDGGAALESAQVLGLPLIGPGGPSLHSRGSAGLGQLIRAALDARHRRLTIGLGGSACNDAGLGLLTALGAGATDAENRPVSPDLDGLMRVTRVALDGLDPRLAGTRLTALCDVDNPLTGADGACRVYGPQKGLAADEADAADAAFSRFAALLGDADGGLAARPGAGAAGGLGFALACLGARLVPGAVEVMRMVGLDDALSGAAAVLTGEGQADAQTLHGKLPAAVATRARERSVPAYLVAGDIDPAARPALSGHFSALLALTDIAGCAEAAQRDAARWLRIAGQRIADYL